MQKLTEEEVVRDYTGMVNYYAGRLLYGHEREDMVSEGFIGLLRAYRKYDSEKTSDFPRHAHANVRNAIMNAGRKPANGPHVGRQILLLSRTIKSLSAEEKSVQELAGMFDATVTEVKQALEVLNMKQFSMQSLDNEGNDWSDSIGNHADYTNANVRDFISKLTDEDKELLSYLYKEIPQDIIGQIMGVSQMTISRYVKALRQKYLDWSEVL